MASDRDSVNSRWADESKSMDRYINSSVLVQVLLFNLLQVSSHLGISVLPPTPSNLRRQVWHRTPSHKHCGSISTGQTRAFYLAVVQSEAELGAGDVQLGARNLLFWVEKGVRGVGRGEAGRWTLQRMTSHHPSPGFTNRRAAHLSGFQGSKKIACKSLPSALSTSSFEVIGPQFESQLCLFLTLWPGARKVLEPRVFRCHMRSVLPTS